MNKLFIFGVLLMVSTPFSQRSKGEDYYQPAKLEQATRELQNLYGQEFTSDVPLQITFLPDNKNTMVCTLQYTKAFPIRHLKEREERLRKLFLNYRGLKGWKWLRLSFKEILVNPN